MDTSVISDIDAPHAPKLEQATKTLFRYVKERADEYELVISPVVQNELADTPEPRYSLLAAFLQTVQCTALPENQEALELADLYIRQGVLSDKHYRDLWHVAYAVVFDCDCIVSWNFKHLVNRRTIGRVNAVNQIYHYRTVEIVAPPIITGEPLYDDR